MAFSGGIDSTFLLYAARDVLGARVIAATIESPFQARRETAEARRAAQRLGVRHIVLRVDPLDRPAIRNNPVDRCYYCKRIMMEKIKKLAEERGYVPLEASNRSDERHFRPGSRALQELGIASPLIMAGYEKTDIRRTARRLGLDGWDKPSNACLASRIPYGTRIERGTLRRIEKAEEILHRHGFAHVRVRDHFPVARIEIAAPDFERLLRKRHRILDGLRRLQYEHITLDLAGYRMGSFDRRRR